MKNLLLILTILIGMILVHTPLQGYAKDQEVKKANGLFISAGNLSPLGLGLLDEQHMQIGTRIGYRSGRLQPFVLFDYARVGGAFKDTYIDYDYDNNREIMSTKESDASISLFTVGAGLKYLLRAPKANSIQTYITGAIFTFIPSIEAEDEIIDEVKNASSFGFLAAFGAQYSVNHRFALGLELGLNYSSVSYEESNDSLSGNLTQFYNMFFLEFVL